jgi:hypothetical protein
MGDISAVYSYGAKGLNQTVVNAAKPVVFKCFQLGNHTKKDE